MNGADLIAEILKKEGAEILPAFPHSDLINSAAKLGIRPIFVRQERYALHITDGYARGLQGTSPNSNAARNVQNINKWCEMVLDPNNILNPGNIL